MIKNHAPQSSTLTEDNSSQVSSGVDFSPDTVSFLVVDDDDVVHMSIKRAFRKMSVGHEIASAYDGIEALNFLRGPDGVRSGRPLIVLLDLNMPRMNGHEFLSNARDDETLSHLPIFVMSTSDNLHDIERAYRKQAAGYIVKQSDFQTMLSTVEMLRSYAQIVKPYAGRPA